MSTAEKLAKFNLYMTLAWVILTFPSVVWWKNSLLWVIVISLWANIVGHFSAYIAARSERAQETGNNLTEKDKAWIIENFRPSPQMSMDSTSTSPLPVITISTTTATTN